MVNPIKKKGAGIDFVLPGSRPAAGTGTGSDASPATGARAEATLPSPLAAVGDAGPDGMSTLGGAAPVGERDRTQGQGHAEVGGRSGMSADKPGAARVEAEATGRSADSAPGAAGVLGTAGRGDARPAAPQSGHVGLSSDRQRGRTGVGLLAESVFESQRLERRIAELNGRVEQLTAERGAQAFDPRLIAPSRWANRHPDAFEGPEFEQLRREIEDAGGNVQPIKIRPIAEGRPGADGAARYEIVFGHRRHRACLDLGLPVLAVVEELNDAGLFVQMERENRGRENLSAWEQGRMYLRAIEEGLFPSNVKLAAAIGRDPSDIGKAVRAAKLPLEVTSAFPSPTAIQFRWVADLERSFKEHETKVLSTARELGQLSPRPMAGDVFTALTAPLRQRGVGPSHPSRELDFGPLGRGAIRQDKHGRTVVELPPGALTMERWAALEAALRKLAG
jgi:ParB family chromosome partitioning protein